MQTAAEQSGPTGASLQLLLFVDQRPGSVQHIHQVHAYLETLRDACHFDLQVIDIGEHPYLAEHFKLIASPALVKIYPEPRQTLAGGNLISQLKLFWPQWQDALQVASPPTPVQALQDSDLLALVVRTPADGTPDALATVNQTDHRSDIQPLLSTQNTFAYASELLQLSDEIFRLKQETEELQEQLLFKDRVIAMLAHDLRNPLTAAAIALETLEMGLKRKSDDPTQIQLSADMIAQLLKHARTQTRAIDRMITDILQGSRDRASKLRLQSQGLDLEVLWIEVLDYLSKQIQAKQQSIKTDFPKDLPSVYADKERVRQVLINLMDNAIKYTPEKGTIRLSMLHRTTQKVQVSICDDGPGIPAESQKHIFEDHYRLQRDEAQSGYGIGLSLCQRIIRAHYGQIWVDSILGQGSCFHFTLPVYVG
jgi:two-component system, OmpR family, clock-associated histidine kinase SasA